MAKIMIVDDDEGTVEMVSDILASEGFEVVAAYDGGECLRKLGEQPVDLVILDMKMPVMDGEETLKNLRDGGDRVPVLCLSAVKIGAGEHMALTKQYNIQGYLFKPISKKALVDRIKEIVS